MKYLLTLIIIYFQSNCLSQKQDYYWPTGRGDNTAFIDFSNKPIESKVRVSEVGFERTNASICDKDGNLLFYTNGCRIADSTHQVMLASDSMNYNLYYDGFLNGCNFGYREKQGVMILPDPDDEYGYYVIHKPFELDTSNPGNFHIFHQYLLYSYVDMDLNSGKGDVITKNDTILNRKYLQSAHTTAINHINGRDWWILQPGDSNLGNIYFRILLTENGFEKIDSQYVDLNYIRDVWPQKADGGGYSRFSPDGTQYAYFNLWDGLHLYDFDRETGLLSNGKSYDFGWEKNNNVWLSSVEFSPDSRFIYLINTFSLYQLDTWEDDLIASLTHIADRDTTVLSNWDYFHMMAAGPDCKIYIRSGSSTDHFSTVHSPNEKGLACDFRQADLKLAVRTGTGNFPYFPRFRVDADEKCDSTVSVVNGIDVYWRKDLKVYPNPATNRCTIELPEQTKGYLRIINQDGIVLSQVEVIQLSNKYLYNMSELHKGIYLIEYLPKDNREKTIYTSKVIKQ